MRWARRARDKGVLVATVEIDALRTAAVGRSSDGEAAMIVGFLAVNGRRLGVDLEGLKFLFGGSVRAEEVQGGNKKNAEDY